MEKVVKDIRRATRRQFSAEEKIRIVLEGLRGEESIAELRRTQRTPAKRSRLGPCAVWDSFLDLARRDAHDMERCR